MALIKTPQADIFKNWEQVLDISTIIVLTFVIGAFRFFPDIELTTINIQIAQEVVNLEEIEITRQEVKPPPPPRLMIPIEAPDAFVEEDELIFSSELDINATVAPSQIEVKVDDAIEEEDFIFEVVEETPEPIGGLGAIQSLVKYPEIAKKAGTEGVVVVRAAINEHGHVFKVEIVKSLGGGCDEAALEAVKATRFSPGKQRGRAIKVWMSIPIRFKLK